MCAYIHSYSGGRSDTAQQPEADEAEVEADADAEAEAADGERVEQRRWLDAEVERVVAERRRVEEFERELSRREELIARKEALLNEKLRLQEKKLRASHALQQVCLALMLPENSLLNTRLILAKILNLDIYCTLQ